MRLANNALSRSKARMPPLSQDKFAKNRERRIRAFNEKRRKGYITRFLYSEPNSSKAPDFRQEKSQRRVENALKNAARAKVAKAEAAKKAMENHTARFNLRKDRLQKLYDLRKKELKKLIDMKLELASERKILNRLQRRNEIERQVCYSSSPASST